MIDQQKRAQDQKKWDAIALDIEERILDMSREEYLDERLRLNRIIHKDIDGSYCRDLSVSDILCYESWHYQSVIKSLKEEIPVSSIALNSYRKTVYAIADKAKGKKLIPVSHNGQAGYFQLKKPLY